MVKSLDGYDEIVRAEVAIEIMNQARGILSERFSQIGDGDPEATDRLHEFGRRLTSIRTEIAVTDQDGIEAIIAKWGPLVKDEEKFWQEL